MKIQSLSNQVYDFILNEIRLGNMPPGHKVNDNALLEKLPTSRTPIREALIQLAADGILLNVPRKGFFVKNISYEEMMEHCRVISQLDFYALKLAIPHLRESHYRRLLDLVEDIDLTVQEQNYREYCELSDQFHLHYYRLSGNNSLPGIIFEIRNRCLLPTYFNPDADKLFALLAEVNLEHRKILELARENSLEELMELIHCHWTKVDTNL